MVGRLRTLALLGELILGAVGSRAESPKPRQPEPFCATTTNLITTEAYLHLLVKVMA